MSHLYDGRRFPKALGLKSDQDAHQMLADLKEGFAPWLESSEDSDECGKAAWSDL